MAGIRIAGLEEVTTLNENMVLATDGPDGTKKINADSMMEQYANGSQMINNPLAVVGSAQQLIGDTGADDTAPYLYRKTPYASDRTYLRKLVGGSVAWNQLVQNGDFSDGTTTWSVRNNSTISASGGICTITPGSTNSINALHQNVVTGRAGHKIFVKVNVKSSVTIRVTMQNQSIRFSKQSNASGNWEIISGIYNSVEDNEVLCFNNTTNTNAYDIKNAFVIDLTQTFGPDIADYAYQLEQSQAGSGIAYLQSYGFLTNDYYTADSGSIQSVSASGKKVVGFNQWDEEWELGLYDQTTGEKISNSNNIRSKNFIAVVPSVVYYCKAPNSIRMFLYDGSKMYISNQVIPVGGGITIPSNVRFVTFQIGSTTYNNDICINISDANKNGQYEPYTTAIYNLPHDTLRGIIKKDASNRLYYDGDERYTDKKVQRYIEICLGDYNWTVLTDNTFVTDTDAIPIKKGGEGDVNVCICSKKYEVNQTIVLASNLPDKKLSFNINGNRCMIHDSGYSDATSFKSSLSDVYLVCELATPITTTEPAYQSLQIVDGDGTEEMIDYLVEQGDRDVAIPVGHETTYLQNLRKKLEDLPQIPPAPTTDGTYTLTATVSGGTATYTWE